MGQVTLPTPPPAISTVARLPASADIGAQRVVTDAMGPVFLATVVGGGAVVAPVMWNGLNWIVA